MNKKLNDELTRLGLNGNGNHFYGALFGYEINVNTKGMMQVQFSMHCTQEQQNAIHQELMIAKTRFVNWQWNTYGILFSISGWTMNAIVKNLETQLKGFCDIFTKCGALGVGYCPVCGNLLNFDETKKCNVNGNTISIDNDCVDKINAAIEAENQQFDEQPNNYLRGFIGAVIGGVAGAVIAIVLYLVGFISAISAFVAFFVGVKLYKKFGGKPNKMMLVIVTATTFVCMLLSVVGIYVTVAAIAVVEAGSDMSAFAAFKLLMGEEEFSRLFWADMAMTVLFTILGCVMEVVNTARKIKRQKSI